AANASFQLVADPGDWDAFFAAVLRPPYQSFFGMLMRIPSARIDGDELAFAQHAHVVRRVLEIGREVRNRLAAPKVSHADPAPTTGLDARVIGRTRAIAVEGATAEVFVEESGTGRDVLLLHTAGSDSRQFAHLM